MTEEEAKEKWCPMVRNMNYSIEESAEGPVSGYNRWEGVWNITDCRCIGSRCMMWRWLGDKSGGWCGLTR